MYMEFDTSVSTEKCHVIYGFKIVSHCSSREF